MNFCYKSASVMQIVGNIIYGIKIVVPLLIIIFSSIDYAKAAFNNEPDKAIKEKSFALVKKIILAAAIFFVPTAVRIIFNFVASFDDEMKSDYDNCVTCLTKPSECDTSYKGTFTR